jgi:RES domain-containing protein
VSSNARDIELLDAIDAFKKEPFSQPVWRITRAGYDPLLGNVSNSRWCNGTFDVIYTSLEREGALAEIYALLSMQPVFPSKDQRFVHKLIVRANETLRIADVQMLAKLGVDISRYSTRDYVRTQEIADAAYFLGFDGLIAPSARYKGLNAMVFTDKLTPNQIEIIESDVEAVDWKAWRGRKLDI